MFLMFMYSQYRAVYDCLFYFASLNEDDVLEL